MLIQNIWLDPLINFKLFNFSRYNQIHHIPIVGYIISVIFKKKEVLIER